MPAVDASGNRIARTLDGGPPQRNVYIPSPVPSPEPTPRSPEPTPLPTERRLPRQVSRRKIAPLSPPTSPTKAERSRGRIHHDRKRASFDAYEPSHVKPAAVALKDWAPTTAVVRRPAEQTPKWDAYHQNDFPPKPDEEEGTVHVRPLFRSHRVAVQRRAAQVGCVGMAHNDPLYLPAHTAAAIDAPTLQKLRTAGRDLKRGICERRHVTTLMECAFENPIVASAKARYCREDLGCTKMQHSTYPKVCEWIARERIKQLRTSKRPFGDVGRRFIPLPACCDNPACNVCSAALSPQQVNALTPELRQMYAVWKGLVGHNQAGVTLAGTTECLEQHGLPMPLEEVEEVFQRYDVDGGGFLDFDEFCGMLDDLRVGDKIVKKRVTKYILSDKLKASLDLDEETIASLTIAFGQFDTSGDGLLDLDEFSTAMRNLGHDLTDDEFKSVLGQVDKNRNFEIDFGEFCQLMGKCEDGQFNVGTSVLQGAFKGSLGLEKIKAQVDELVREATDQHGRKLGYKNLPHGVSDLTLHATKPFPSLEATFLGEILVGTPYEGRLLRLRISGDHCYPVSPPRVAFTRRVIHLNFDVAPSGETFVSQLLNTWSGVCDVKWLLDRIVQLLREPEPDLVPAAARPENALARDGDEDGDGGIDDEAGARGTQPLGNDLRVKRQADRLAAELFRLHRDRPRRYKALARQHALRDLEESLEVPAARLDADEAPELPVPPSESSATEDEDEAPGAGSPARRRRAKSDKRSVGFAVPA
jgi:Ca2+-binding EF-hand superfamily protein/ubiquitin-protein ligase